MYIVCVALLEEVGWFGEMAQWLRAGYALAEDPDSVLSTHLLRLLTTPVSGAPIPFLYPRHTHGQITRPHK